MIQVPWREPLTVIARLENRDEEFTVQEATAQSRKSLKKPFSASHVNQMLAALTDGFSCRYAHCAPANEKIDIFLLCLSIFHGTCKSTLWPTRTKIAQNLSPKTTWVCAVLSPTQHDEPCCQ
jgi:hypothetical protein